MALWICFEGLPGVGKSTAIAAVMAKLTAAGYQTRAFDADSSVDAQQLHDVAKRYPTGHKVRMMLQWTLRLLQFEAMRGVDDSLDVVIADRFYGSALVYDQHANGVPPEVLSWALSGPMAVPALTFFFDAPIGVCRERKAGGAYTIKDDAFARTLLSAYRALAAEYGWVTIDATLSVADVAEICFQRIRKKVGET